MNFRRFKHAAAASLILTCSVAGNSLAQQASIGGNIDLNPFRPAVDSRGYITVNASQVLGHKELSFGIFTNWGHKLLKLENGDQEYVVKNIFSPTLQGAFGLKLGFLELEFAASVPFNIMNGDRGPDFTGDPNTPNDDRNFKFDSQGLGDIGVHFKTRFLNTSKGAKIGLGLVASVWLPTASEENAWLGEGGVTPQVLGVLDKEFGNFKVAANGGIRVRSEDRGYVDIQTNGAMVPSTGKTIVAKSLVPLGLALSYAVVPQKFDVIVEGIGGIPLGGENYAPAEAIGGLKVYLGRNSFLTLGGGVGVIPDKGANPDFRGFLGIVFEPNIDDRDRDGLKDDVDKCPDDPEDKDDFEDEDGCPEPDNDRDGILDEDDDCPLNPEDKDGIEDEDGCPEGDASDRDGDGILDNVDKCPDDPEDKDGFEDADGCPELDNDGDGILDVDDLCPNNPEDVDNFEDKDGCPETDNDKDRIVDLDDACPRKDGETREQTAETYNGNKDDDGCPDTGRVVVTKDKLEILDKIFFEFDSDVIKSESFPILDALVATMQGNPEIQLVEIQGHTDERGNDAYNLDLSDRRAASVRRYMIEHGVEEKRLQSQGYGETVPLVRKSNEAAWAKNRRVEFLILKRGSDK